MSGAKRSNQPLHARKTYLLNGNKAPTETNNTCPYLGKYFYSPLSIVMSHKIWILYFVDFSLFCFLYSITKLLFALFFLPTHHFHLIPLHVPLNVTVKDIGTKTKAMKCFNFSAAHCAQYQVLVGNKGKGLSPWWDNPQYMLHNMSYKIGKSSFMDGHINLTARWKKMLQIWTSFFSITESWGKQPMWFQNTPVWSTNTLKAHSLKTLFTQTKTGKKTPKKTLWWRINYLLETNSSQAQWLPSNLITPASKRLHKSTCQWNRLDQWIHRDKVNLHQWL